METNIGIKKDNLKAVCEILSKTLADEFLLYTKTRNAHWNIEGTDFHAMHKFFESQYEQLDETMDDVAERIRSLGHYAPATLASFLALTHLSENSRSKNDSQGFIQELLGDHAFWSMYGMGLPDDILKKVYFQNALRIIPNIDKSLFAAVK